MKRAGITRVESDRTLPLIYVHVLRDAGIEVHCDLDRGVASRRAKDEAEIEHLREAQRITEGAMEMACGLIAGAKADRAGLLHHESAPLTAERVRAAIDVWLLEQGYTSPGAIVACGSHGADCHNAGSGPLRGGEPVIVDIFPQNRHTLYNGDCTRTVVHGDVPDQVRDMRRAVAAAKAAAIAAIRAGVTGEQVHGVTTTVIEQQGYSIGLPAEDAPEDFCAMVHGTGHGVGLEVHEPPLLDMKGPELVAGDAVTVEPGVYSKAVGGVRLEDLVIATSDGCINLNQLPEELTWK